VRYAHLEKLSATEDRAAVRLGARPFGLSVASELTKTERHGGPRSGPSGRQQRSPVEPKLFWKGEVHRAGKAREWDKFPMSAASLQKLSATEDRAAVRPGASGAVVNLRCATERAEPASGRQDGGGCLKLAPPSGQSPRADAIT
jgi:hypothetical protein